MNLHATAEANRQCHPDAPCFRPRMGDWGVR